MVIGEYVQVNMGRSTKGNGEKLRYATTGTKFHPNQVNNGGGRFKVATHRAIVEADMNGLTLKKFIWIINHDWRLAATLNYLEDGKIVHHKNEDTFDNSLSNLEVLDGVKEHSDLHDWENNVLWQVGFEAVISVDLWGMEAVYDLEIEDDPHNFLANGFVVHNCGKTTFLTQLSERMLGHGQYTAFNKSLVLESKTKFDDRRTTCSTTHSLAFRAVGNRYAHRLEGGRIRSEQIALMLNIQDIKVTINGTDGAGQPVSSTRTLNAGYLASQVMGAVKRFRQSADARIGKGHFKFIDGIDLPDENGARTYTNNEIVREYLTSFAVKAWTDLSEIDGQLPFCHDDYVKIWQLSEPVIPGDYIFLDEDQDTAPVFLDILKQQKVPVVLVGDECQIIYEWRGAINAAEAYPQAPRCYLTQSFRFGRAIADVANSVLALLEKPVRLRLKGLASIPSKVEPVTSPVCVLTRTNAAAVGTLLRAVSEGKRPFLVGGGAEVISFVEAALALQKGRSTSHPDLGCFDSWSEVQAYVKTDEGEDLKLWVKLIDAYTAEVILAGLRNMPAEKDADLVVCTAHKSKGREWDTVQLAGDFPVKSKCGDSDLKLLYVAATRAKLILDVSQCPFFTGEDSLSIVLTPLTTDVEGGASIIPPAPASPPRREEFSWAKGKDGSWLVRGPSGKAGETVEVVRKDGSTSRKVLCEVIWEGDGVALYRV